MSPIEPDNVASRRALERAGFEFIEEVDSKLPALELGLGPRQQRYAKYVEKRDDAGAV